MPAFRPVSSQVSFAEQELQIGALWTERRSFERSVEERPLSRRYVFYDGPPFATGLPHYGHLVASTLKDIVPRYWAMRGYRIPRRFGWDTHGLPIEMIMEKELGLSGPSSVREYGVDRFNEACRANVLKYTSEWRRVVGRLGRWVDFDDDYKTMDPSFMESVWWVFRQLWDKGLIYEDFRVMPYSWRLSTPLSNFEANLDYRDVQDPAITLTMPVRGSDLTLLVWTTTPWTLPSNLAIAVHRDIAYAKARRPGEDAVYVVAEALVEQVLGADAEVLETLSGEALIGLEYEPLFDYHADLAELEPGKGRAFVVIHADHVTTESGTGLVHMAPDFGDEDYIAARDVGISVVQDVDAEGRFEAVVTDFAGRNVKEADPDIIRLLKERGRIIRHDTISHSYPFCWRSGTPLIYRAQPARFVRVTELSERMVELNKQIHWVPEAVGHKRFGNWLADARDWNISRNRFWGTPIPIWQCAECGAEECMGSIAQLEERTGAEVTDLHPHRIDHLTMPCAACSGTMRRIADVFDCWFESGSMPYAQGHYPFEGKETFEEHFPAQFIAEGLDQTRGWFYTLLVLSTALFDKPPFLNCIVNGMVLAEDGAKMSKSKRNYPDPSHIFEAYGADALRAYLIDSPIVRAQELRFSEAGVRDVARTVLIPLQNAWAFFVQYANIDGWSPGTGLDGPVPAVADRPELDRWLLSTLQSLVRDVNVHMERYHLDRVIPAVVGFIDDLTNWYIRLSRRRFWRSVDEPAARLDKACAYATLYEALVGFSKVMAPFLPYLADAIYQNLVVEAGAEGPDSVHLCDFPEVDTALIDTDLEEQIALVRQVVRMGRKLRERHRLKTRQPLATVTVVHHGSAERAALREHTALLADELNVKDVDVRSNDDSLATRSYKADFKRLGRRYGKRMKEAAGLIAALSDEQWHALEDGGELVVADQALTADDIIVVREPAGEVVIETRDALLVALDTHLTEALVEEGLAREVTSRLQRLRKEAGLEVTDRIRVTLRTPDDTLLRALQQRRDAIAGEVLAVALEVTTGEATDGHDINGHTLFVELDRA